ncbi:MAG: hypothetical protein JJE09_07285 [Bacteroidia bacterium]|nr:hypothetical protein [Bacteroidia bacterium]
MPIVSEQCSPAREVSIITHRNHIKTKLIKALKEELPKIVPQLQKLRDKRVVKLTIDLPAEASAKTRWCEYLEDYKDKSTRFYIKSEVN